VEPEARVDNNALALRLRLIAGPDNNESPGRKHAEYLFAFMEFILGGWEGGESSSTLFFSPLLLLALMGKGWIDEVASWLK